MPLQKEFGDLVPYGDPDWYRRHHSPYYNESHVELRARVREFVDEEIEPYVHDWDEAKEMPKELFKKIGQAGLFGFIVGPPWPTKYCGECPIPDYDIFHMLILVDEICRCGSGGVSWGIFGGMGIGLPPIVHFGLPGDLEKQDTVLKGCFAGDKAICLAITEPNGGSDVANMLTTAELTPDGEHYIVNGQKKWITNGVFADYFTVAVRTGGEGFGGLSMLLLEKGMPGLGTRQMDCSGVWSSGTCFITMDDVKVPKTNIIGVENQGFLQIVYNFNLERWGLAVQTSRFARVCFEESFKYAHKRKTFGKRLIDHPVIRQKLAEMARQIEATHHWVEAMTYQLKEMPRMKAMVELAGEVALLKVQTSKTFEFCAREAAQIFGGAAYTRTGVGEKIERMYREVRAFAIPGGSEEIMQELCIKQAMAIAKNTAKL